MTRSILPPTRTSSAPCRSMSSRASANDARRRVPFNARAGQRRRQPPPGAQNSIEPSGTQIGVPLAHRRKNLGENQRAIGGPRRFGLDRRDARRKLRRIRGRLQIHAEPDHDELERARLHRRLRENACELAAADQHVVRPLDLRGQSRDGAHALRQSRRRWRASAAQRDSRRSTSRARRPDDHRHIQPRARRREPDAAVASTPRRLRLGDNGRALFGARLGETRRDVVGRSRRLEPVDAPAHRAGAADDARDRSRDVGRNVLCGARSVVRQVRFQS